MFYNNTEISSLVTVIRKDGPNNYLQQKLRATEMLVSKDSFPRNLRNDDKTSTLNMSSNVQKGKNIRHTKQLAQEKKKNHIW